MDMKLLSTSQQLRRLRLRYLESATSEIEMLQKELEKLENQLYEIEKISVRDFIQFALKIRNISNVCAEIMKNANTVCYESFANVLQELD